MNTLLFVFTQSLRCMRNPSDRFGVNGFIAEPAETSEPTTWRPESAGLGWIQPPTYALLREFMGAGAPVRSLPPPIPAEVTRSRSPRSQTTPPTFTTARFVASATT